MNSSEDFTKIKIDKFNFNEIGYSKNKTKANLILILILLIIIFFFILFFFYVKVTIQKVNNISEFIYNEKVLNQKILDYNTINICFL